MKIEFSIDSIEYLADKLSQCRSLSDESLTHLTAQVSTIVFSLLQNAVKVLRKCHRQIILTEDFEFALKLNYVDPQFGGYSSSSKSRYKFRKIRKDNRVLHQIDDQIIELDHLINFQPKMPVNFSIRTHWLTVNGQQPLIIENPIVQHRVNSKSTTKFNGYDKRLHILSYEQQIYYKQLTEMCINTNEYQRKQALIILMTDDSIQQISNQLVIFISEGLRINLIRESTILNHVLDMTFAFLQNKMVSLEPYLHYLFPAILSCLLKQNISIEHWSIRDLAGKCTARILQKYSTAANRLQQRTIAIFYRILLVQQENYSWPCRYGALVGLCEMGPQIISQLICPRLKQLAEQIQSLEDDEIVKKITEAVVKYVIVIYRKIQNDNETNVDPGPYFSPLIQRELVLLL